MPPGRSMAAIFPPPTCRGIARSATRFSNSPGPIAASCCRSSLAACPSCCPPSEEPADRFLAFALLLQPLEKVQQDRDSHPEGDALYHSLQVFELARQELPYDEEFLLAALLHDVGKAIDSARPRGRGAGGPGGIDHAADGLADRTSPGGIDLWPGHVGGPPAAAVASGRGFR